MYKRKADSEKEDIIQVIRYKKLKCTKVFNKWQISEKILSVFTEQWLQRKHIIKKILNCDQWIALEVEKTQENKRWKASEKNKYTLFNNNNFYKVNLHQKRNSI